MNDINRTISFVYKGETKSVVVGFYNRAGTVCASFDDKNGHWRGLMRMSYAWKSQLNVEYKWPKEFTQALYAALEEEYKKIDKHLGIEWKPFKVV